MSDLITSQMLSDWRANYGLDKRTPIKAMHWWQDNMDGKAPAGVVAALGLCINEIERLTAALQHEADCVEAAKAEIERLTDEDRRLRADLLAGRNVVNAGLTIHTLTAERDEARQRAEYWKAEHLAGNAEVERLRSELYDCIGALPGTAYYLDPPDGGSVTIAEQLRRMGEDAARYRHLRACVYIDPQQSILRIANVYLCRDDGPDVAAQLDAAIDAARGKE